MIGIICHDANPFLPIASSHSLVPTLRLRLRSPTAAYPLQNIRAGLADANRVLGSSAPESEKAEARIELDVYEGLQAALNK
jgi:hypothetical protein